MNEKNPLGFDLGRSPFEVTKDENGNEIFDRRIIE